MIWIEGVLALSVMKITLNYARDFKVLPAYYTGFTATCRDEARHVQGGMRFVRDLLDEDPTYVRDMHDTLRTLLTMGAARSGYIYYEPLGWSEERVQASCPQVLDCTVVISRLGDDVVTDVLLNLDPAAEVDLSELTEQVLAALDPATAATVRKVSIAAAGELPTGATGKVRKAVLREQRFRDPAVMS